MKSGLDWHHERFFHDFALGRPGGGKIQYEMCVKVTTAFFSSRFEQFFVLHFLNSMCQRPVNEVSSVRNLQRDDYRFGYRFVGSL
jgi:hypothetical protein